MIEINILDERAVSEIEAQLNSGSLLLPLRVEGWHMSLSDGGWHIKNASDRIVMTVRFVPVEIETGKPALEGNAPARHTAALLNSIPALCATVKHLRAENERLETAHDKQGSLIHELRGDLETRTEQREMWRGGYDEELREHSETQLQLEQLRAENEALEEKLKRKSRELISLKGRCHE